MDPQRVEKQTGADRAPEVVTGWFMGSVVGYRLMVGWMAATLLQGAFGLWLLYRLVYEVARVANLMEAR